MLKAMLIDSLLRVDLSEVWLGCVLEGLFLEHFVELRGSAITIHWHRTDTNIREEIYLSDGGMWYEYDLNGNVVSCRHEF